MKQSTTVLMTLWMLVVVPVMTTTAFAVNTTNDAADYAESFEGYADGQFLVGTGGWYSDVTNAVVVTATNYVDFYKGDGYPIAGPHTKVLEIASDVTNRFETASPIPTNWVDHVIKPAIWDQDDYPDTPDDALMAYFFNTNMTLVVMHSEIDKDAFAADTNAWLEIDSLGVIGSSDWVRVTIELNFKDRDDDLYFTGIPFYRIYLNNTLATHESAFVEPNRDADRGGSWFGAGLIGKDVMSEWVIQGTGFIDDLVATDDNPLTTFSITASVAGPSGAGTITPSGKILIDLNGETNFVISAETYYQISDVIVDGDSKGPTNAWTFTDVTKSHAIQAVFAAEKTEDYDVPHWWLNQTLGLTSDFESALTNSMHGKPFTVWEEYWASTDPDDPDSIFRIEQVGMTNGVPYVVWYSSAIDPQLNLDGNYFIIECTTNLASNVWFNIDAVTRQGTNTWSPPTPPDGETFYRIKVDIPIP